MRFAAGAAVFPGGRIDPDDFTLARQLAVLGIEADDAAARLAAIRETLEEAGLVLGVRQAVSAQEAADARALLLEKGTLAAVLETFGWSLDLDLLVPFARWVRPEGRAFDTRFYLADLGTGAVPLLADGTEHSQLLWISASDALAAAERGDLHLIYPTLCNLHRLAGFANFAAARADALAHPPCEIVPQVAERDGVQYLTIPEGIGYPVTALPLAALHRG